MLFVSAVQNALSSPKYKSAEKQKKQKPSIDSEQLTTLLQLEAVFHERLYNIDHVTKLLEIYSYLVELLEPNLQSLKDYFLEKMEFILSRPETIEIMMENDERSTALQNRYTTLINSQALDQLKLDEEQRFNRPFLQQNSDSNSKMRFSVFKKHQAKEREICMEVQERKQDQKGDLNSLLQEYDQISKEYDNVIKKQLQDQNNTINQRMAIRKNKKKRTKQSNSQENKRTSVVNPVRTTLSKWKLITEIQESAQFWRQSINKIKK
ncbi:unnamed protein product [Paramecium primaurelia]|uniref:Uncharacterized protein n=2 Tax=Paramecium TaxID=5884 RepID=A0A8S1RXI7_9CILI|nr:unnamed protein product [Paramecium primaurelia]CAD8132676.1 unnamed protein product [Paramecium pentaurelia]